MATSNRDRIGQMLDVLSPALDAYLQRTLGPSLPKPDMSWIDLMKAVDGANPGARDYSARDPYAQLKFLSQGYTSRYRPRWRPLRDELGPAHEAYAAELLDVRNKWVHHGSSFNDDDAYRALDTAERLLTAINATREAGEVGKIRTNLRRVTAERDDKRALKEAASESPASSGLRPWREVLPPHDDVATGNFTSAEFAADLFKVSTGEAGSDYTDPVEFFRRTYLTQGLRDLLGRAVERLAGDDNASPVINLQTNFGGGKTHSMLALWHLASGTPLGSYPQEMQELLVQHGFDALADKRIRRVSIVGNHFAATGEDHDGITVRTIWGELAWQLGGLDGYAMVADADEASTPPGAALHRLLAAYAPAVILIDEWVAYARTLYGVTAGDPRITGGSFESQFTFAQSLTEAVKATSGVVLAISVPASETGEATDGGNAEEVGGSHGQEALRRLQNVVRRVAEPWRPASATEAYHIVRQRLFTTPDAQSLAAIGATARAFSDFYRRSADDFPREAKDSAYEDRIKAIYPIHPELFDRLYEDWSSLERFQRTRGVLRLMNAVIHSLWVGEDAGPLILPGSLPLSISAVNTEIAQYLPDSWKTVIDADVDGPHSEPAKIDTARPQFGARSLTKRLARTVFFGAVPTIGTAQKGIETQRVFLGTAVPGDRTGDFHAALNALGDRATYFYSGQGKYWYDLQANITRSAKDQAERLHREDVWAEIVERLRTGPSGKGLFARVHPCPADHAEIPDLDEARLVVLHPKVSHRSRRNQPPESPAAAFARDALERRGTANRTNRNMLVFVAADELRLEELERAVRDYLGWKYVLATPDLDLTDNQKAQATEKKRIANETVDLRLLATYQWALHPRADDPKQPWRLIESRVEGQQPSLAERVSRRLSTDGDLTDHYAMSTIRHDINRVPAIWSGGHVSVGDLWALYAAYPYLPRLRDREVLEQGLTDGIPIIWDEDGFALATARDEQAGRYAALWLPGDTAAPPAVTTATLLVSPAVARAQREAELPPDLPPGPGPAPGPGPRPPLPPGPGPTPDPTPVVGRFFGAKELSPARYTLDFKQVADEVLVHLARPGTTLRIRVEIEAEAPAGFDESTIRVVRENATTLRFDEAGFDEFGS